MTGGRSKEIGRCLRGLTLVEVVAALVILGVLLALIVKASTQSTRQMAMAEQRLFAAREADRMIAGWYAAGTPVEPGFSGRITGKPPLYWDTVSRESGRLTGLGARVVQLRVFAADGNPAAERAPQPSKPVPVITVDLLASVLPLPELPPEDAQAATRPSQKDDREDPRLRLPPSFLTQ